MKMTGDKRNEGIREELCIADTVMRWFGQVWTGCIWLKNGISSGVLGAR